MPVVRVAWWLGATQFAEKAGLEDLPQHGQQYPDSKLPDLVENVLSRNLNVLLRPRKEESCIDLWIDDKMFTQR